jgi:predicted DNA-binding protein
LEKADLDTKIRFTRETEERLRELCINYYDTQETLEIILEAIHNIKNE